MELKVPPWEAVSNELHIAFINHYPRYLELFGTPESRTQIDAVNWLRLFVYEVWKRFQTLEPTSEQVEIIIQDAARYFDSNTVTSEWVMPLMNFAIDAPIDTLDLPNGICLKRLTEQDVTDLYGGSVYSFGVTDRRRLIHEFALVGELSEPKVFGEQDIPYPLAEFETMQQQFDMIVLALRTFKTGAVGYNTIWIKPKGFTPRGSVARTYGHEYVPFGIYNLAEEELQEFANYVKLFTTTMHPSLEIACSRLSDGSIRTKDRDRLLDAVIGMEAILLSNVDMKTELRYRFSLHYASLFDTPAERVEAAMKARRLYDARSVVAHGGKIINGKIKVGKAEVELAQIAGEAIDTLRTLVRRFLPSAAQPEYLAARYWDARIFNA